MFWSHPVYIALQQILTIEVDPGTHSVSVCFCKERMTVEAVLDVALISSFCHFLNLPQQTSIE